MSWGKDFLNEHVGYLQKGDFDGLMNAHYHEDATCDIRVHAQG